MKTPEPKALRKLSRLIEAQEMAIRAAYSSAVKDERALLDDIERLSRPPSPATSLHDIAAGERWKVWAQKQRKALYEQLSLVRARKEMLRSELASQSARREAVSAVLDHAATEHRKRRESLAQERLLGEALSRGAERRR